MTAARGLAVGRFQPFHLGHLDLVRQILSECDGAIIAVASSQFNYIRKDPFTAGERIEMIHESLQESELDASRCVITAVENQPNVATWAAYLEAALPRFERVYSGNEYVRMLLSGRHKVVTPRLHRRESYSSTRIRDLMARGVGWEEYVPPAVARIMRRIGGSERVRVIYSADSVPTEH